MSQIPIKGFVKLLPPPEPAEALSLYFVRPAEAAATDPFDLFFSDADGTLVPLGNISFVEAIVGPMVEGLAPLNEPFFTGDPRVEPADDEMHVGRIANIGYVQDKIAELLTDTINDLVEARVPKARPIVSLSADRTFLPAESGTEFRCAGAFQVELPPSSGCVVGETVFFIHVTSNLSGIDVAADGTDRIQFRDESGGSSYNNAALVGVQPCGFAEIRYVAAGKWRAAGNVYEI